MTCLTSAGAGGNDRASASGGLARHAPVVKPHLLMNPQGVPRARCAARVGFRRSSDVSSHGPAKLHFSEGVIRAINIKCHHTQRCSFIPHPVAGSPGGNSHVPRSASHTGEQSGARRPPHRRCARRCPCSPAAAGLTTGSSGLPPRTSPPRHAAGRRRRHPALGGRRVPATLNAFQADADATHHHAVAGPCCPRCSRSTRAAGRSATPTILESAKVDRRPSRSRSSVYKLNQQAVWSDGREIGAADFAAQWRALRGKDTAYWTARNAGYDRIEKIETRRERPGGQGHLRQPYADWRSLFTPLYPKEVMGTPDAFNDGARQEAHGHRRALHVKKVDREDGDVILVRNPRWWGDRAKLDEIVLDAVTARQAHRGARRRRGRRRRGRPRAPSASG